MPSVLAVGVGGVVWKFFSHLSFLYSFSLSLGDGPIKAEEKNCLKGPLNPKQPIIHTKPEMTLYLWFKHYRVNAIFYFFVYYLNLRVKQINFDEIVRYM